MQLLFAFRLPLCWALLTVTLLLLPTVPKHEADTFFAIDKLLHFLIFFPLPFWWLFAWEKFKPSHFLKRLPLHRVVLVIVVCLIFGAATEVLQGWLTLYRKASLGDFFANALGILSGAAFFLFLRVLFLKAT